MSQIFDGTDPGVALWMSQSVFSVPSCMRLLDFKLIDYLGLAASLRTRMERA